MAELQCSSVDLAFYEWNDWFDICVNRSVVTWFPFDSKLAMDFMAPSLVS